MSIRLGIIGMGMMGKGLFYQAHITPNIECVAIANLTLQNAVACAEWLKRSYRVVTTQTEFDQTLAQGILAVCQDGQLIARNRTIDVLLESSSAIGAGGEFVVTAMAHGQHVVLMNAEIDLMFGPYFQHLATQHGVIYTSCDGDQHGVLARLINEMELFGLQLVMAGNMKGFLNRYANPTQIKPEADKRTLDYKMATAFTDGTKLAIEMALLANGRGLTVKTPGMAGPRLTHVSEVFHHFSFSATEPPWVDYILGAEPNGGIFAVGYCPDPYQQFMLDYYKLHHRDGFYLFYRPYHLCHVEGMRSVIEAVVDKRPLLHSRYGFLTQVYAYAKRALKAGEVLDGVGGYCCYGLIQNTASHAALLPLCLADQVTLTRDLAPDEPLMWADIEYDPTRMDFTLYEAARQIVI